MSERERFEKWFNTLHVGWDNESAWWAWQAAIQSERERCAKIAKLEQRHWASPETETALLNVEDAIRRGEGGV